MSDGKALQPIEQKQVLFYEDTITAVLVEIDGKKVVYVPLRPICDYLGLSWPGQRERMVRDVVLAEALMSVRVTRTDINPHKTQPHNSEMVCLPLEYLNGWLFGITATRVKEEIRDRLIRYQRECYRVLADAFLTPGPSFSELMEVADPNVVEAYQIARAVMKLAQSQIELESRLNNRLNEHHQRLESIEAQLGAPGRSISPEQATNISQAVKAIAMFLSKKDKSNQYGSVYGELYRKFGIPTYRELPAGRYEECMDWLRSWWQELTNDSVPF